MSVSKAKTLIGLILIVVSILSLVFWEFKGREMLLMDKVLIVKEDIDTGTVLSATMFSDISVPNNAVMEGSISPSELKSITGKIANTKIYKGSQLSKRHFESEMTSKESNLSYFVIPNEWIYMCSSSVRAYDKVDIISSDGSMNFGRFELAFVKDSEGKEISVSSVDAGSLFNSDNRSENSSPINHVEIICDFEQYSQIKNYSENQAYGSLIFINRGK